MTDLPDRYGERDAFDHQAPGSPAGEPATDEATEHVPDPEEAPVVAGLPDGADPRVAAAVARLDELGDTAPAEHIEVYEDIHRVLQDALADASRGAGAEQEQPGGPRQ